MGAPGLMSVPFALSPASVLSIGLQQIGQNRFAGWSENVVTANVAYYFPFRLPMAATLRRIGWMNGDTVAGNVDAGVYRWDLTRLTSTGSTAMSGTAAPQSVDITDVSMPAGRYYMAIAVSDATAQLREISGIAQELAALGCFMQASALPLPSTATPATLTYDTPPFPILIFGRYT